MKRIILVIIIAVISILLPYKKTEKQVEAYSNYCWRCKDSINSSYCSRCSDCGWYICINCGACKGDCERMSYSSGGTYGQEDDDDGDFIFWLLVIGVGLPAGLWVYDKYKSR